MGDADALKKKRSLVLGNFTRSANTFEALLKGNSPKILIDPAYQTFETCWASLGAAQDEYLDAIDDINVPGGLDYLNVPGVRYTDALLAYAAYLKAAEESDAAAAKQKVREASLLENEQRKREAEERQKAEHDKAREELGMRFASLRLEVDVGVESFGYLTAGLQGSLEDASEEVKREQWLKVDTEFGSLRSKLLEVVSSNHNEEDLTELKEKFKDKAEESYLTLQKWVLPQLKGIVKTSGGGSSGTTKREAISLPDFKGDPDSQPFLKFPVWLSMWEKLIVDYPEQHWSRLLSEHLDDIASEKFVGLEDKYKEAMEQLKLFYGDPCRVVECVMKEVKSPGEILDGDYHSLVAYSDTLSRNFTRLKNIGLEHEMSNTSAMSWILRKLPMSVGEKWQEHLAVRSPAEKMKPFPVFIEWMMLKKEIWGKMALCDEDNLRSSGGARGRSYYQNSNNNNFSHGGAGGAGADGRKCHNCKQVGHIKWNCPSLSQKPKKKERKPCTVKKFWCAFHKGDASKRCFSDSCNDLAQLDPNQRVKLLKENGDCVHCVGDHKASDCSRKTRICGGRKDDRGCKKSHCMHELFCVDAKVFASIRVMKVGNQGERVLLLIMKALSSKKGREADVFFDYGSDENFVRDDYAREMGFKGTEDHLNVTTLGDVVTELTVMRYRCSLRDVDGKLEFFEAYGMETITGSVSEVGADKLQKFFPRMSLEQIQKLQRGTTVDFLIGMRHPSWHPERVEKGVGGGDFWMYRGKFGSCVGGRCPGLAEGTKKNQNLFTVNHKSFHISSSSTHQSHRLEFCPQRVASYVDGHQNVSVNAVHSKVPDVETVPVDGGEVATSNLNADALSWFPSVVQRKSVLCAVALAGPLMNEDLFFQAESLGTVVEPRCGGCKCSKCPVPGSIYSFKEQREHDTIWKNLFRVEGENRWYTEYPWTCSRCVLPKNEKAALQNLISLERSLAKNMELAEDFSKQIDDMVERGTAIILKESDLEAWKGDYYYLPMVGVKGKKKWLRVCFDASRRQCGCRSLNDCLMKGPDRFLNNLLAVIVGFRNGRVGAAADIAKFHNQVYVTEADMHMQRFLWRKMNREIQPTTYAVKVNNFGVVSANCIATCALHRSADHFAEKYPEESREMKEQTYIDDQLVASEGDAAIRQKTARLDEIGEHAGMPNKGWTYSGDKCSDTVVIGKETDEKEEKVLGMTWIPSTDSFKFNVALKFRSGTSEVKICTEEEFRAMSESLPITRRSVLANVARVFDPSGFLTPIILQAKLLMRESWSNPGLGWDDPLPDVLKSRWVDLLASMLRLQDLVIPRSLWPMEEVVGLPSLVVFTDGSAMAFGAVAYIRWQLTGGSFWTRLVMAKGKIAPKGVTSIPRLELNGAVIGTRVKNFLTKDTSLEFSHVYHLVDSSTVLGYVHKESGNFRMYEGVRVAEIQSSTSFEDGLLLGWFWVTGEINPADWCTKPRPVADLVSDFWLSGPQFLSLDVSQWPVKSTYKSDGLDGEIEVPRRVNVVIASGLSTILTRVVLRYSSFEKVIRILARMSRLGNRMSSEQVELEAPEMHQAKTELIKFAQEGLVEELKLAAEKGQGRFRKLAPAKDEAGVWRVGARMRNHVPFTADGKMPALLPPDHRLTTLVMEEVHRFAHPGMDGTLSRFRSQGYWTVRGGHLAKKVRNSCVPCRKDGAKTVNQTMGEFPPEMLKDPKTWGYCQLDLFGPFHCRSDVNPRASKKTWAVVVEDVNSGAVHLDVVSDYSAEAVLMTMRRFGALRGWPGVVHSDPGSQLVAASNCLTSWWSEFEVALQRFAAQKRFQWLISPPDSPWRQGKAERRIGIVKRLIKLAVGDSRVTPIELQTILYEVANICNERPIGLSKPREDGSYDIITPNQLLLGRSHNVLPDDAGIVNSLPVQARYRLLHHVTTVFWEKWSREVSPQLVVRQKWHTADRNLKIGDLVMICESSRVKAMYKMGVVDDVATTRSGAVRAATVRYSNIEKNTRGDDIVTTVCVTRAVQRLVLIMPVEELEQPVQVKEYGHFVQCAAHL